MRKIMIFILVGLMAVNLTACGGTKEDVKKESERETQNEIQDETKNEINKEDETDSEDQKKLDWPKEFGEWGIPIIKEAVVSISENRSMSGEIMVQGVTASVNLKELSKDTFNAYGEELESKGFVKNLDSLEDVMEVYEKNVDGGVVKVTISFSEDITTIIANNSAADVEEQEASTVGKSDWPVSEKDIPEFTKGNFKETIEMGEGMYTVTYTGVTTADLDWYRNILKDDGFNLIEDSEEESYGKMTGSTSYAVGFIISGDTVQFVVMNSTY